MRHLVSEGYVESELPGAKLRRMMPIVWMN